MAQYRNSLPQLGEKFFLTDGGAETTLIFLEGLELPDFAAFHLLKTAEGQVALRKYFRTYAALARRFGTGFILESATWRASADWGTRLGYSRRALAEANRRSITLLEEIRDEFTDANTPMVVSGCLGPRGDGYIPDRAMNESEAEQYHRPQVEVFADSAADMVSAITMNYVEEAIGIARAARGANMPVTVSFTVETDGNLPTGQSLAAAITQVDEATNGYPAYYMLNCAHPTHFAHLFGSHEKWHDRLRGLRANSSAKSHAELNESTELDIGNPAQLGTEYADLKRKLPNLTVLGGCCGTDQRHVEQIAQACGALFKKE